MKRGPYKQYLLPGSNKPIPKSTKKRRGIEDADLNLTREEEVARWLENPRSPKAEILFHIEENPVNQIEATNVGIQQDAASLDSHQEDEMSEQEETYNSDSSSDSSSSEDSEAAAGDETNDNESISYENESVDDDAFTNPNQFEALNDFLQKNNTNKNLSIDINPADIIIMILTLAVVHNLTLNAIVDVLKILNVICCCNLFPSTKYLLKKLFNPSLKSKVHLVCQGCRYYLGVQGQTGIRKCSNCGLLNDVRAEKYDYAFITFDIKEQLLDILQNSKCKFNLNQPPDLAKFKDINSGSLYRHSVPVVGPDERVQYISLSFNVSSTPISKDAQTSITPIYLTINELDLVSRRKNLILAGIWYGKVYPRNDTFLKPFTDTFNSLRLEGIKLKINGVVKIFKLLTICCCVNPDARSPLQGIIGVNGNYCCSWCEVEGSVERNTIKYNLENPSPRDRTEENFRENYVKFTYGDDSFECKGVNSVTPLINLRPFSIVWGFVPDYLNCVLLGVVKRFLDLWLSGKSTGTNKYYIGTQHKVGAINDMLAKIRYPQCLKRGPIPLEKRKLMKGRDFENWLLYYSVPMLTGILHEKFLNHWKLLVCGISTLLQDEISMTEVNQAELKFVEFVYYVDELYDDFELTYDVHQLLHLAESCRRWGPLWTHTTFPFESSLRKAKRILKVSQGVPHQIVRSLEMNRALEFVISNHNCSKNVIKACRDIKSLKLAASYMSFTNETLQHSLGSFLIPEEPLRGLPENMQFTEYERLVKDNIVYRKQNNNDRKTDDSYVRLYDDTYAQINNVLCSNTTRECYLVLQSLLCEAIQDLPFTKIVVGIGEKFACSFKEIHSAAIRITVDNNQDFISCIPRKHYILNL